MMMKPEHGRHGQWCLSRYKGNTNFKDNMEELFIKVCEKMDEKPPVTDKEILRIWYKLYLCVSLGPKDGLGNKPNFGVPSPHSQKYFL